MLKLLLVFLFPLVSMASTFNCKLIPDHGCLYMPDEPTVDQDGRPTLVLYHRGHYQGTGTIPAGSRVSSAKQAFSYYKLKEVADSLKMSVYASGSSHLTFEKEEMELICQTLGYACSEINFSVVSHSGGYFGMFQTIQMLLDQQNWSIGQIVFLDSYYTTQRPNFLILERATNQEIPCMGFLTNHNLARFKQYYQKYGCWADGPSGMTHSGSVPICLPRFLLGQHCQ